MRTLRNVFGTVAPAALLILSSPPAFSGTLEDNFFVGTSGDGLIFSDPAEGVLEPGIKAVTFTRTRLDDDYVDPYEVIITDFSSNIDDPVESRGEVTNCLMSNNAGVYCDSESGSGKRIKTQLTGPTPFDIILKATPSDDYPKVDYFTFGKTSNFTGARIVGFRVELLDADGNLMEGVANDDGSNAVLFNLNATNIGIGARLPDGLFGSGGHESEIGFFSDDRAGLALTPNPADLDFSDYLDFGALSNEDYTTLFGEAFLDNSMTPDGLFWDDNDNPDDESALVAWNNLAGGGWTYGNIGDREEELAAALGVSVEELDYEDGSLVPEEIVQLAQANGLFEVAEIEDIRNANLNFTITVGNVDGEEFILRFSPRFEEIVEQADSEFRFKVAGHLDAAANVPYLDLGNAEAYGEAIDTLLEMEPAEFALSLDSIGFSFAPAFASLGFEGARNQVALILDGAPKAGSVEGIVTRQGDATGWQISDNLYGLVGFSASSAEYDATGSSTGYGIDTLSLTAGVEAFVSSSASIGMAVGVQDATADAYLGLGKVETNGMSLSLFGRKAFANGLSMQGTVGYQDLSYDSTRNVMGETAVGSTDGSQFFAALEVNYQRSVGALTFGPTASVEYYDIKVDGFDETGAGIWNLSVGAQSDEILLTSVGLNGEYQLGGASADRRLTGGLKYTRASGDDRTIQNGFVGLPGAVLPIEGLDDDWIEVSLGYQSVLSSSGANQTVFNVGYGGAFGSDYENHRVQIGLNLTF